MIVRVSSPARAVARKMGNVQRPGLKHGVHLSYTNVSGGGQLTFNAN